MEFHISRRTRDRYQFDQSLFSLNGNVILANFRASRQLVQQVNLKVSAGKPGLFLRAGQLNAMGLIDEIFHYVFSKYREQTAPNILQEALADLYAQVGKPQVDSTLLAFTNEFPPLRVYQGSLSVDQYLAETTQLTTGEISNLCITLEEMLLLWLANSNPAFSPFLGFFNDTQLQQDTAYPLIIARLKVFFEQQPQFGPQNQNLIEMLRSPIIAVPHSLPGQLDYIRTHWGYLLGDLLIRLLSGLDFLKEEDKAIFSGSGPSIVYKFDGQELEYERFSTDRDWMPRVVLIAKNAYVWLDQLSKQNQRSINRLDQIPDDELDQLARWGFSGLWLIGLWERSPASKTIKQMRGNPEAVASAYSLYDYTIAADLGGDEAFQNLRTRAWQRGLRLASDMVPNHMGIDSPWVIHHPEWFISQDFSPFPSYNFSTPNLSNDDRVGIFIEEHYFNNTDAAVVFKRTDHWTGQEKYIYHGNDGTSMPWNDTAQLNYLLPEVREAVIQTILHVARNFPIIRFDAAMTLAKKHYQRLWYPEPGHGGDIPSRAEHPLTKEEFNAAFPQEFWREVVDRVTQEVPDTLLLAEAFWLMEGYFVRTLGMHRVYNSAFMNMLRDEKNQDYRLVIKNTLEFDPQILKRYVNFMNNPDEKTAVDQFGKGDKYFGICTMMATLPGLPMFGHGQIQGYTEKYGMEYRRAYWDETIDQSLVHRHEREIFPLLSQRHLFCEAENFLLYDFFSTDGSVNEDVFAYTNQSGTEHALIVYHNRFANASGWIRLSAAYPEKREAERILVRKSVAEGLGLLNKPGWFTLFSDNVSGLEYIRSNQALHENGLFLQLDAYQYHVFLNFRQVQDTDQGWYSKLWLTLNGRGVNNINHALRDLRYQPIQLAFRELVNAGQFGWLIQLRQNDPAGIHPSSKSAQPDTALAEVNTKLESFTRAIQEVFPGLLIASDYIPKIHTSIKTLLSNITLINKTLPGELLVSGDPYTWSLLLGALICRQLGTLVGSSDIGIGEKSITLLEEWGLEDIIQVAIQEMPVPIDQASLGVVVMEALIAGADFFNVPHSRSSIQSKIQAWFNSPHAAKFLKINEYEGIRWFNKERFSELLRLDAFLSAVDIIASNDPTKIGEQLSTLDRSHRAMERKADKAKYQVDAML